MILGLDPGHGGRSVGTRAGGIEEKVYNLQLALELVGSLPQAVMAEMTRQDDEYVNFNDRAIRSTGCDRLVSVHVNACRNARQHGAEIYILPEHMDIMAPAARRCLEAFPRELRSLKVLAAIDPHPDEDGDWQEAPINVLKHHACPSMLVEVCYASNPADILVLQSIWGRTAIVSALRAGVAGLLHP